MNHIDFIETPIGAMVIRASKKGITRVDFVNEIESIDEKISRNAITDSCKTQLQEYFDGQRNNFSVPFDQQGSPFQHTVWSCLTTIPFGETASYSDIANRIENPKAVRAVGAANGKNPIAVIVPCHRIIGSNGSLTGYAGGLKRKMWLLRHEGHKLRESAVLHRTSLENLRQKNLFE